MAELILVTGGSRSGKSTYAQELAEELEGPRIFVATCPPVDDEMTARIARHRAERDGRGWTTVEEPVDLAGVLGLYLDAGVLLVDCLTLWVSNLMHTPEGVPRPIDEPTLSTAVDEVLTAAKAREGVVILVTNEVGMGIVPENAGARLFRDLVGRCNQRAAQAADRAVFMVSGIGLDLKR